MHSNIMYLGREIVNKERTVKLLLLLCIGDDVVVQQHYDETRTGRLRVYRPVYSTHQRVGRHPVQDGYVYIDRFTVLTSE